MSRPAVKRKVHVVAGQAQERVARSLAAASASTYPPTAIAPLPPFETTARQDEQHAGLSKVRHFCAVGGSRSTKTFGFVYAIGLRAMKAPGTNHGIFRFRANAARASISLDTLPKVFRLAFPDVPLIEHRQDGFFQVGRTGSRIWIGGLDDDERVEKILGNEFLTLFFNECSQIPYASVLVGLTRLAQSFPGVAQRAFYDLNPVGKGHWTNKLFGEKKEPRSGSPLPDPENYARLFMHPKENPYLSKEYLQSLEYLPERQRKRFFDGVYVDEVEGALWPLETIERSRCEPATVDEVSHAVYCGAVRIVRIAVAVDPSGASDDSEEASDEIGIVVVGLGEDKKGYVLEDCTLTAGPAKWGRAAVAAYHRWGADVLVAEVNYGGDMVAFVISTQDKNVHVKKLTASRGKTVRAEPVSALYEKGGVRHAGRFPVLEDQMAAWSTAGYTGAGSPDRADALVWGVTELMLQLGGHQGLLDYYRELSEAAERERKGEVQDAAPPGSEVEQPTRPSSIEAPGPGGVRVAGLGAAFGRRPAEVPKAGGASHPAANIMFPVQR